MSQEQEQQEQEQQEQEQQEQEPVVKLLFSLVGETISISRHDIAPSRRRTSQGRPAVAARARGEGGKARRAFPWRGAQLLWPNVLVREGESRFVDSA